MSRTNIDWSGHVLTIKESQLVTIHELKIPNNMNRRIVFINCQGVMTVTGDYGNWVFCRTFHPKHGQKVDDYYWCEKLSILSHQQFMVFDKEATIEAIKNILGEIEEYGYSEDKLEAAKKYYKSLIEVIEDGADRHFYINFASTELPYFMDLDDFPLIKDTVYWLKAVFDAFEEICRRLPKEGGEG